MDLTVKLAVIKALKKFEKWGDKWGIEDYLDAVGFEPEMEQDKLAADAGCKVARETGKFPESLKRIEAFINGGYII